MKKVLLIGKANGVLKDLFDFLSEHFHVQACPPGPDAAMDMVEFVRPDAAVVSLVGAPNTSPLLFKRIEEEAPWLPVITIETEEEKWRLEHLFNGGQFENVARPVDNKTLLSRLEARIDGRKAEERERERKEEGRRKLVLAVDDDPAMLRTLGAMLKGEFDVAAATSGAKAMEAIGRRMPDAILLDYEMPVCDGRQALEMIRSEEDTAGIPVVFLTGVKDRAHIEAVLSMKPSGYLLKPPSADALIEVLRKATAGGGGI